MPEAELPLTVALRTLDDAAELGIHSVRIYGGEPLIHPQVTSIVAGAVERGFRTWIATNGMLLRRSIDDLYAAGLRSIAIPLYGTGDAYDRYVQVPGAFKRLVHTVDSLRANFGNSIQLSFSWLLAAPFCDIQSLRDAWSFSARYDALFYVDIVHSELPYFTLGPDDCLRISDPSLLVPVIEALVELRKRHPKHYREPITSIRSIPDWIFHPARMRVPCDMYKHVWVGPDGSVQLCYSAFRLGNVHCEPLRAILYTNRHKQAAVAAFRLNCPSCPCNRTTRVPQYLPSATRYALKRLGGC